MSHALFASRPAKYLAVLLLVSCSSEITGEPGGSDASGASDGDASTAPTPDAAAPSDCGNSSLDPGEACDGALLSQSACSDLGYTDGPLSCNDECQFVTDACTGVGVAVHIESDATRQTFDGFGFFGPMRTWWSSSDPSDFYSDTWLDLIIDELGVTIWRNEYYSEESNQDTSWAVQRPVVEALQAKADASGVDLKIIATVWSPPSQWKDNGSLKNGGHLIADYYDEFGQWLVDGIAQYEDAGVDLYGISPQNEPLFAEPYNSGVYTADEYREMLKVVGPIVHSAYPEVNIYGPEHMLFGVGKDWDWDNLDPSQATLTDPDAGPHLNIWACHGYSNDGITPTPGSTEAEYWTKAQERIDKPRWMTETSGRGSDWNGVFSYIMSIHAALYYGQASGWVHWYGADDLVTSSALTKKGYAARQYFRYVRPGAQAVSATVDGDDQLLVTAFEHRANGTFTVVAINAADSGRDVYLVGNGLPTRFHAYRTSESEDGVDLGEVSAAQLTLPSRSITTLFAQQP